MNKNIREFRLALSSAYSLSELKVLMSDMGIDWEDISGENKAELIVELISYLDRRNKMDDLIKLVKIERPGLLKDNHDPERKIERSNEEAEGGKQLIEVMLVDDHEVVKLGLSSLLQREHNIVVTGVASTAVEAIEVAQEIKPDVVVMDIRLPGETGIYACEEIVRRVPNTKVIMFTSYAEPPMLNAAIQAGAAAYELKQVGSDTLIDVINKVYKQGMQINKSHIKEKFQEVKENARLVIEAAFENLTELEAQVLLYITEGRENEEIARLLYLKEVTIEEVIDSIISKIKVKNRREASAYAVKNNIRAYLDNLSPSGEYEKKKQQWLEKLNEIWKKNVIDLLEELGLEDKLGRGFVIAIPFLYGSLVGILSVLFDENPTKTIRSITCAALVIWAPALAHTATRFWTRESSRPFMKNVFPLVIALTLLIALVGIWNFVEGINTWCCNLLI